MEVCCCKGFKDETEVLKVFFLSSGPDHTVVEIDGGEFVEVGAEDVVHDSLAGGGGVGQAKRHHGELVVSVASLEGCLVDVVRSHGDLVVG